MGTSSENALVMAVPQNLEFIGISRKGAAMQVGRQGTRVPGNLKRSKFFRRLLLMLFLELPEKKVKSTH